MRDPRSTAPLAPPLRCTLCPRASPPPPIQPSSTTTPPAKPHDHLTSTHTSSMHVHRLADDMGWGDWSRTGGLARTPHLDAWSRSDHAVWFQRAYSGNPICSPTRASLQTGRTPARTCIYAVEQHILCHAGAGGCTGGEFALGNATRVASREASRGASGEAGEADDAGEAGDIAPAYLSAFYGKWHLGSLSDRGVGSPDCYEKPANTSCLLGYWERDGGCCFGVDGKVRRMWRSGKGWRTAEEGWVGGTFCCGGQWRRSCYRCMCLSHLHTPTSSVSISFTLLSLP